MHINETSKLEIEATADVISAIAHPLRLAIVRLLAEGELSVNEICDSLWSSQPNISRHLGILRSKKVVLSRKESSRILYSLVDHRLKNILYLNPQALQ